MALPRQHQQKAKGHQGQCLCPCPWLWLFRCRAAWPGLARARLGNGLPGQAGPLQPAPGAAPRPLLTPQPAVQRSAQHQHLLPPGAGPCSPPADRRTPAAAASAWRCRWRARSPGCPYSTLPRGRAASWQRAGTGTDSSRRSSRRQLGCQLPLPLPAPEPLCSCRLTAAALPARCPCDTGRAPGCHPDTLCHVTVGQATPHAPPRSRRS